MADSNKPSLSIAALFVGVCFVTVARSQDVDSKSWRLVFKQRLPGVGGGYFKEDQFRLNPNDPTAGMFAVLDSMENYRNASDPLTFKMVWPGLCQMTENAAQCTQLGNKEYNIWQQMSNPYVKRAPNVDGYTAVDVTFKGPAGGRNEFGGLEYFSPTAASIMDGTLGHGNWWYSIGQKRPWGNPNRMPAGFNENGFGFRAEEVELYLWADDYIPEGDSDEWNLVLRHDVSRNNVEYPDDDGSGALEVEVDSSNPENEDVFSKLGRIFSDHKDELHTFKLVYPDLCKFNSEASCDEGRNYIIWEQKTDILAENVKVIEDVRIRDGGVLSQGFKGLSLADWNNDKTLLTSPDGQGFEVGAAKVSSVNGKSAFEGPFSEVTGNVQWAQTVELYVWTPHVGVAECNFGRQYFNRKTKKCVTLTECVAGSTYQTKKPTGISDRECSKVTTCDGFEYEAVPADKVSDRVCLPLTICMDELEYELKAPTGTTDRVCAKHPVCTEGLEYQAFAGTKTSPRVCLKVTPVCLGDDYEARAPSATTDRICMSTRECRTFGNFMEKEATPTEDAQCNVAHGCDSAKEYEYAPAVDTKNTDCRTVTKCEGSTPEEVIAKTATSDRVCGATLSCITGYTSTSGNQCVRDTCACSSSGIALDSTCDCQMLMSAEYSDDPSIETTSDGSVTITAQSGGTVMVKSPLVAQGMDVGKTLYDLMKVTKDMQDAVQALQSSNYMLSAEVQKLKNENAQLRSQLERATTDKS